MTKIAVYAKLTAAEGKADELVDVLKTMFDVVPDEQGTLFYALHRAGDNPNVFWFYELYSDQDAFDTHGKSEGMRAMFGKLGGLLAGPAELIVSEPVAAKGFDL